MNSSKQTLLTQTVKSSNHEHEFFHDLCETLVAANIPWNKLSNNHFCNFLQKYCNQKIPDESTLRKYYLDGCYNSVLQDTQNELTNCSIFGIIDEMTDSCGCHIANLIACEVLDKTNQSTIACFVDDSLRLLRLEGCKNNQFQILLWKLLPSLNLKTANL